MCGWTSYRIASREILCSRAGSLHCILCPWKSSGGTRHTRRSCASGGVGNTVHPSSSRTVLDCLTAGAQCGSWSGEGRYYSCLSGGKYLCITSTRMGNAGKCHRLSVTPWRVDIAGYGQHWFQRTRPLPSLPAERSRTAGRDPPLRGSEGFLTPFLLLVCSWSLSTTNLGSFVWKRRSKSPRRKCWCDSFAKGGSWRAC